LSLDVCFVNGSLIVQGDTKTRLVATVS